MYKAGKGRDERGGKKTKFKEHYVYQIMFYREILRKIQDYVSSVGRIVNVDKEIEEFETGEFEAGFREALAEVERLVSGAETSEPILGSVCHQCCWYEPCRSWAERNQDPTLLYFVGKRKFDLKRAGLQNVADIAGMHVQEHLTGAKKIPRLGEKSLRRMKERAQVLLSGKPAIRPGYSFPAARREIYFDIEDDPTRNHTYLFGFVIREGSNKTGYGYFLASSPAEEEATFRSFWQFVAQEKDAVFYVYSHKERSSLKRLSEHYGLDPDIFNRYVESEYDLYQDLVVEYSDWPTYSYGIKLIAKMAGFKWRDPDPSGANSIAWYNEYLENPSRTDILQRILDYNEDDCRAMIAIKDYFEACLPDIGRG